MEPKEETQTVDVISAEFFQKTLRQSEGNENLHIINFDSELGSQKGDNYGSMIFHVNVKAKVGDKEKSYELFAKKVPDDQLRQKLLTELKIFPKEREVYWRIFRAMVEFQKTRGVENPILPPVAKIYTPLSEEELIIIFENLLKSEYKMADKLSGLDYDHCELLMRELGKFHAITYCMKQSSSKKFEEEFPCLKDPFKDNEGVQDRRQKFMEESYALVIGVIAQTHPDLADKMKQLQGKLISIVKKCVLENSEGPDVIIHGDCWVNNMMFKYEDRQGVATPVDVKLVDFQAVRQGCLTVDLNYFFHTSTTRNLRQKHLRGLLQLYHSTFLQTVRSLDFDLPQFTFEAFQKRFDKDRVFGCIVACMALPMMMARPEESIEMEEMDPDVNKLAESFRDQMTISIAKLQKNQAFLDRLLEIVQDMEEHGLI